jgi:hypothetical protein
MPKDPVLDEVMVQLTDQDAIRFRDCIEGGVLITGGLGSGKSSTSARTLAKAFLRSGKGGLVLAVKSDEPANWVQLAKETGREKDLLIFDAASGLCFDFVQYSWAMAGKSAGQVETVVELLTLLTSIGKPQDHSGSSQYFENAVEEILRATIIGLSNAGETISITSIHEVISSLPTERSQVDDDAWRQSSAAGRMVNKLYERQHSFTESQWGDIKAAIPHLMEKWPDLDSRTRSNVESTWSGMASKFIYDPARSMYCGGKVDFTPEQMTHEHLVVVLGTSMLEYGKAAAKLGQVGMKIVCQRAFLRHPYKPGCCHGAFIFEDEFAQVMHRDEQDFHMVCRASAIAPICILPNILNMAADEFGEQTPGSRTLGFLGLLALKIFHANNETRTNEFSADQIGREFRFVPGWNAGTGDNSTHTGMSGSMQLQHIVEPVVFTRLLKPDAQNLVSQAIVYLSGRVFRSTISADCPEGRGYLSAFFSRE